MKRLVVWTLAIVAAVSAMVGCLAGGSIAHAEESRVYQFGTEPELHRIYNVVDDNGSIIGVSFGDYYFGDISVSMQVYSDDALQLGFPIGSEALTAQQSAVRSRLVGLFGGIDSFIRQVDALVNTSYGGEGDDPISDVFRFNHAEQLAGTNGVEAVDGGYRVEIGAPTYAMLQIAQEMYTATNGAFNPAVYRLVDLWGFSSRIYSRGEFGEPYDREVTAEQFFGEVGYPLPGDKYIEAFSRSEFTDFSPNAVTLQQQDGKWYVTKHVAPVEVDGVQFSQWIDLGGIAKGYVADVIMQRLKQFGATRFYVNAGQSSMAYGLEYTGEQTLLGVQSAYNMFQVLFAVPIGPGTVSTSGQYVRKYVTDGVEYAHILDGTTGRPAQTGIKAVTVIVPEDAGENWAAKGDCLTTALTVLGRDGIVQYANGYLAQNNIKFAAQYETSDGRKQLLTNYTKSQLQDPDGALDEFGWALEQKEGMYSYNAEAKFDVKKNTHKVLLIVLGSALGIAAVALCVFHFVKGGNRTLQNVQRAKKDKPFKMGDLAVYTCVALAVAVLFVVFVVQPKDAQLQRVTVSDDQTGETLLVYNLVRGEYVLNEDNLNGWQMDVQRQGNTVTVRFSRQIDGEQRFNLLEITLGSTPSVKMTDSLCGFHQDCVRNFPAITRSGGAIVCSPNRLKVVTE